MWVPWILVLRARGTVGWFWGGMRLWTRILFGLCGFRLVSSREAPAPGSVVYVSNHQAMLDIPALTLGIDSPFVFVARSRLRRVPFVGSALRFSPSVLLEPGGGDEALAEAAERVSEGISVLIFPEGTRSFDGQVRRFKSGAFRLALGAGVPVVPVAIDGAHRLLDEKERTGRRGRIDIRVGAPMPALPGETDRQWAARARVEVKRLLANRDALTA